MLLMPEPLLARW